LAQRRMGEGQIMAHSTSPHGPLIGKAYALELKSAESGPGQSRRPGESKRQFRSKSGSAETRRRPMTNHHVDPARPRHRAAVEIYCAALEISCDRPAPPAPQVGKGVAAWPGFRYRKSSISQIVLTAHRNRLTICRYFSSANPQPCPEEAPFHLPTPRGKTKPTT
jgi:hypothetical protein